MFNIPTARTNVMVAMPHSLCFNLTLQTYNRTCWKQMMPSLTHQLDVGLVAQAGKAMGTQQSQIADLTYVYEPGVSRFIYYFGSAVNDIQALSSGFAGGDPTLIANAAATIYNTYLAVWNTLKAQGSNVRGVWATNWAVPSFWSGTDSQTKTDKAAVLLAVNQKFRDNAAVQGYVVSDEATIDTTGALGDAVHTNELGNTRRAAVQAPVIDALCA